MFRFKKKGDQRRRLDKNATMRPREQAIVYYSQKVQKNGKLFRYYFLYLHFVGQAYTKEIRAMCKVLILEFENCNERLLGKVHMKCREH